MANLDALRGALLERGVLADPRLGDGIVRGRAPLDAAGAEVAVVVDPETDDGEVDLGALVDAVERVLTIDQSTWRGIVDAIVAEIEDAVGDEPIQETTSLEDDLVLETVVVLTDAVLLWFHAPKQFPDSRIRVQLDEDLELDDLEVDDAEEVEFDRLDNLLDHVSE